MEKKLFVFDLGNFNMKLSDTLCVRNDYIEFNANEDNYQNYDIEIGNKKYKFGTDTKFYAEEDKVNREQLPMILYGINQCCSSQEVEAYLFLGVPNDEFILKDVLINKLKSKTFVYKDYNDIKYTVLMKDVKVYREGTGAWFTIDSKIRNSSNIILLDIGGRTINMIVSRKGVIQGEYVTTARNCGMIKLYKDLNLEYSKQIGRRQGDDTIHLVPDLIESKLINLSDSRYASIVRQQIDEIYNKIRAIPNFSIYDIYLSGGGAETYLPLFLERLNENSIQIINDYLFANRKGAVKIARTIKEWRDILSNDI